ncbi:hypothetical protein [uncultured Parabacteroides sp.]|uniref:hypothetical protein n=1 Tax=uncultured Parabacteroides sp. TaxID=512312 RepID=UPI0025D8743E|nr:hypothetical protein [uncultured Parabacteroides sp.]
MKTFTLVPVGGLGNRIQAISSAITFCQKKNRRLTIIWFKDHGLNCDFDLLFTIDSSLVNVEIRNATIFDFVLRDNPRKRNLWVPLFFEKLIFDKSIYYYNGFYIDNKNPDEECSLDQYENIYMVSCCTYWEVKDMYKWLVLSSIVKNKVLDIIKTFPENTIGIHIRRTDNWNTVKYSPTELFIDAIEQEIMKDRHVHFYLASDSFEEKQKLKKLYGNQMIIPFGKTSRNSESGIIDAFVELNVLARTKKIYAGLSSFALIASKLLDIDCIWLDTRKYL